MRAENVVQNGCVVSEIRVQTDVQTDTQYVTVLPIEDRAMAASRNGLVIKRLERPVQRFTRTQRSPTDAAQLNRKMETFLNLRPREKEIAIRPMVIFIHHER